MAEAETVLARVGEEVELCVELFGSLDDPALLLIGGATWSMDWWEDALCHRLADRGRLVVRYDQRDTGRSTSYPPGCPGYTAADLVGDAVAVLDRVGVDRGHVVGLSMGGGVAQRLAAARQERVATLTLISTTPVEWRGEALPPPAPQIRAMFAAAAPAPDWRDREAVVNHVVEGERPYAGPGTFDEARMRALAGRVVDRTNDMASCLTNHFVLADGASPGHVPGGLAAVPTLVVHGTADPLFPFPHGAALAGSIPGARLLPLDGVGHQLPPAHHWGRLLDALVEHTAPR